MTQETETNRIHFPALLEMVGKIPQGNQFSSARLRLEFEREGRVPHHSFWPWAINKLIFMGLIRKAGHYHKSIIPASRGRKLIVWERA